MKKLGVTLLSLCLSSTALATDGLVTLFNTSQAGYMTVYYKVCHYKSTIGDTCGPQQQLNLNSAKQGKHSQDIVIPVSQGDYTNEDSLIIDKVIEIVDDKKVAETRSASRVCAAIGGHGGNAFTDSVLELTDMNGSSFIACKSGVTR